MMVNETNLTRNNNTISHNVDVISTGITALIVES